MMQFLSTDYKFAVSFIILVIVLIIKPTGILAERPYEKYSKTLSYLFLSL